MKGVWYVQGEDDLLPPPTEEAGDQDEDTEDDSHRLQGTDIEQGNTKVPSPSPAILF